MGIESFVSLEGIKSWYDMYDVSPKVMTPSLDNHTVDGSEILHHRLDGNYKTLLKSWDFNYLSLNWWVYRIFFWLSSTGMTSILQTSPPGTLRLQGRRQRQQVVPKRSGEGGTNKKVTKKAMVWLE